MAIHRIMETIFYSVIFLGAGCLGHLIAGELRIFPAVELEFSTVAGGIYQVQVSSNLVDWSDCENPVAGDGTVVTRLYSARQTPFRFFRLLSDLPPAGTLTNHSGCKSQATGVASVSEECLQYDWTGQGTLVLKHINAGFNCCAESLLGSVTIQDRTITLTESEVGALCHCNCLYELDYVITNLDPGLYTLLVVPTGYVPAGDLPLTLAVDLTAPTNGVECVRRSGYPWNVPAPTGTLVAHSPCKNSMSILSGPAGILDSPSSSEGCLEYQYQADTGTLRLTHVNAGFNCCPQVIHGVVTIDHNQINIVESEDGGLCMCLCLYDLDFEISNLVPGTYTIDVTEPLLPLTDPRLTVTLDLVRSPTGLICLPRSGYPWGL